MTVAISSPPPVGARVSVVSTPPLRPDLRVRLDGAVATLRSATERASHVDEARAALARVLGDVAAHVAATCAPVALGPCAGVTVTRGRVAEVLGCSSRHVGDVVRLACWRAPWPDARQLTTDRRPGESKGAAWARRDRARRGVKPRAKAAKRQRKGV